MYSVCSFCTTLSVNELTYKTKFHVMAWQELMFLVNKVDMETQVRVLYDSAIKMSL